MHVEGHPPGRPGGEDVGEDFGDHRPIATTASSLHRFLQQQLSAEILAAKGGRRRGQQVPEEPGGHQGGRRQYQVEGPQEEKEEEEDHRLDENVREDDADEAAGRLQAAVAAKAKVGRHALDQSGEGELPEKKSKKGKI